MGKDEGTQDQSQGSWGVEVTQRRRDQRTQGNGRSKWSESAMASNGFGQK